MFLIKIYLEPRFFSFSAHSINIGSGQYKRGIYDIGGSFHLFQRSTSWLNRTNREHPSIIIVRSARPKCRQFVRFGIVSPASMPLIMLLSKQTVDEILLSTGER